MNADARRLDEITEKVIGCAFNVSNVLGIGFLEKVYENALAHEIMKSGLTVKQQKPIQVSYDGAVVGDYTVDLLVQDSVLVELKAVKAFDETLSLNASIT
jgi:GxxExxY protein